MGNQKPLTRLRKDRMKICLNLPDIQTLGKDIFVIGLTGQANGGKSHLSAYASLNFSDLGKKVLLLYESAERLAKRGIHPARGVSIAEFQKNILYDTFCQELSLRAQAMAYRDMGYSVIVLVDRPLDEGIGFFENPKDFDDLMYKSLGVHLKDVQRLYHSKFFISSDMKYFSRENNVARQVMKETPEQLRTIGLRLQENWEKHPHPVMIKCEEDFEVKKQKFFAEVCTIVGEPPPPEIIETFLIDPVDLELISNCCISETVQHLLISPVTTSDEHWAQLRHDQDGSLFFRTVKTHVQGKRFSERSKIIDRKEYDSLLNIANTQCHVVKKTRVTFKWKDLYYQIDIFEEKGVYVMSVGRRHDQKCIFPEYINVLASLKGNNRYSDLAIAQNGSFK